MAAALRRNQLRICQSTRLSLSVLLSSVPLDDWLVRVQVPLQHFFPSLSLLPNGASLWRAGFSRPVGACGGGEGQSVPGYM